MIDIASGAKLAATPGGGPSILEWSADSHQVAFFGGVVLRDDGTVFSTGAADVAFAGGNLAVTTWRGDGSAEDGAAAVVAADGSRRVIAHRASDIAGGPTLAVIVDPPDDTHRDGPRGGAVLCLLGQNRALASFPNSDPGSMAWSPDGQHLTITSQGLNWTSPKP